MDKSNSLLFVRDQQVDPKARRLKCEVRYKVRKLMPCAHELVLDR